MEKKEEKKKRWRPSLGLYREQLATITALKAENELLKNAPGVSPDLKALRAHIAGLEVENGTLKRSNELMEDELKRLRSENKGLLQKVNGYVDKVFALMHRSFWDRLLNKEV